MHFPLFSFRFRCKERTCSTFFFSNFINVHIYHFVSYKLHVQRSKKETYLWHTKYISKTYFDPDMYYNLCYKLSVQKHLFKLHLHAYV